MTKYLALGFQAVLVAASVCPTAMGQAAAEYGLGAARAATTAAPARELGKSIKGAFDTLNKTLEPASGTAASGSAAPGSSSSKSQRSDRAKQSTGLSDKKGGATPAAAPAKPTYEDPRQIQAGIAYDEMLRRFGPPSMSITDEAGKTALSYSSRDNHVQVEVENGKVTSVAGAQSE